MSLIYKYDGGVIAHNVAPSGIQLTHRADMGESSFGGIPIEDPAASLTLVGHKSFTVEEDDCAQPRLFTGWTTERGIGRDLDLGMFVGPNPRVHDLTIIDLNALFSFRQITGADGNRPDETWEERLDWILNSDYLDGLISTARTFTDTWPNPMDAADYRGSTPAAVLDDLAQRFDGAVNYFAFWDPAGSAVSLFFDHIGQGIATSTLSISNVYTDVDNTTCFAPDSVAVLAREPDQVYSEVVVEYYHGTKKLFRKRPSTEAAYIRRGTTISRPYTGKLSTATAQADQWLATHAVETDRITCSIQVPSSAAGLIQAGQLMDVRFSHMPGYANFTTVRVVSCSPKPTDDTGYWYTIALELVRSTLVDTPCVSGLVEWVDDGQVDRKDLGNADSPKTTAIPQPGSTPCVILAGIGLHNSYTAVNDYLANVITVGAPWTMLESDSDAGDVTYRQKIRAVAYLPWTSGPVDDVVFSWSGVYTRPGEGFVMSVAIQTASTAPVQSGFGWSATTGSHVDLPDPPTEGNLLVMYGIHTTSEPMPDDHYTWTLLHRASVSPVTAVTEVWVRCVEAGESAVIPVVDSTSQVVFWACSEWTVDPSSDAIIPLPPAPGSTTTHTVDPTVNDDAAAGYTVGSTWINTTDGGVFVLVDSTTGAAVWVETTGAGAPTAADYLVGTAQAGLSAEIVVGTTPGGELGGTWASPTVDATHSGSAHLALGATSSTAAAGDHTHAGSGVGPLLIEDTPAGSPLVFADIIQNEEGTDLLYADTA